MASPNFRHGTKNELHGDLGNAAGITMNLPFNLLQTPTNVIKEGSLLPMQWHLQIKAEFAQN